MHSVYLCCAYTVQLLLEMLCDDVMIGLHKWESEVASRRGGLSDVITVTRPLAW